MNIGKGFLAVGAAIVGPLALAVKIFASAGDQLDKMSKRTGVAGSALAEYGFALEQSGSSLGDFEKAMKRQSRTITDAGEGLSAAQRPLQRLGLTYEDLKNLKPEQQFDLMAERLNAIEDATLRSATAQEIWGRAGTMMLPALENLRELREEARRRGLVPTDEAIKQAAALTDAFNRIKRTIMAVAFEAGAALAPMLLPAAEAIAQIVATTSRWVRENGRIIRTAAMIGLTILGIGAAITAAGLGLFVLGSLLGAMATIITTVGAVAGLILSPLGLVLAAIVGIGGALIGAGVYWAGFTESGRRAISSVISFFQPFVDTVRTAVGGIGDALMAGDLELAGQIAVTALKLLFAQGINWIADMMHGVMGDALSSIASDLLAGDFAAVWETVVAGLGVMWSDFVAGMAQGFADAANFILDVWRTVVTGINATLLGMEFALAKLGETGRKLAEQLESVRSSIGSALVPITTTFSAAALGTSLGADDLARRAEDAAEAFGDRVAGGRTGLGDDITALEAELAALRDSAAKAREAAKAKKPGAIPELEEAAAGARSPVLANSLALAFGGGGSTPMLSRLDKMIEHEKAIRMAMERAENDRGFYSAGGRNRDVPVRRNARYSRRHQ
jgi:hypothetical protein